jgi:hypothetical protein
LLSTDQASGFRRRDLRIPLDAEAVVLHRETAMTARLLDVSRHGAALSALVPPPRGAAVRLELGSLALAARVVWTDGRRFGLHFESRLRATDIFLLSRRSRTEAAVRQDS